MAKEINITPALNLAARIWEARLRFQAPVKTGALKSSVRVSVKQTSSSYQLVADFNDYGIFTDSGTKRYHKPSETAPWNGRPGIGKGGIKPRYWTNIQDQTTLDRVKKIIEKETAKQIVQAFRK